MAITHVVDVKTEDLPCHFRYIRNGEMFIILPSTYKGALDVRGKIAGIWIKTLAGKSILLEDNLSCHRFALDDRVHRVTLSVMPVSTSVPVGSTK